MASGTGNDTHRRQRRMGPAPFASFEDLSDEADSSPGEGSTQRLPGINEDASASVTSCSSTLTPSAPRIDISRASSSSQHEDSRDSTPERELFQAPGQRLGLAFREEGALDLRSSTEELDFQDPNDLPRRGSPATIVTASSTGDAAPIMHQRKDSQGSEFGGLLSISGRTSRLSSIGSQGSRVSEASRLSVTSGISRSPSPHKMLLETSFCGSKADTAQNVGIGHQSETNKLVETELLERVLLSRKHDPTEAILAEGISIECRRKIQPADFLVPLSPVLHHVVQQAAEIPVAQSSLPVTLTATTICASVPVSTSASIPALTSESVLLPVPASIPPEKPARKSLPPKVSTDVIITLNKPSDEIEVIHNDVRRSSPLPGKLIAESGIEYTFIPLKGPLPKDDVKPNRPLSKNITPSPGSNSAASKINNNPAKLNSAPIKNSTSKATSDPQYIRIKLKPDHMYSEEPQESYTKPATLDLSNGTASPVICRSPLQNNTSTPSPSVSRKSSFASLFRAKDYGTSPESPTVPAAAARRKSSRSRSKSSDRDRTSESTSDRQTKHRSVFTLFKSKKTFSKSKQSLTADTSPGRHTAASLHSLEFTFDRPPPPPVKKYYEIPLDSDTIIIPLHSPGSEPQPLPLFADDLEPIEQSGDTSMTETVTGIVSQSHRQSSTSSENVVFSTNLGSENEIFTTKLPKRNNERERRVENQEKNTSTVEIVQPPASLPLMLSVQNGLAVELTSNKNDTKITGLERTGKISAEQGVDNFYVKTDEKQEVVISEQSVVRNPSAEENHSSESDSEALPKTVDKRKIEPEDDESGSEHERKGLVLQQDSFEDELPYVPTTLPLERSVAVPIVPIKQRAAYEIRTCPIERPRSTTPINPSCLEDYCEDIVTTAAVAEKLRISLPREDSISGSSSTANVSSGRVKSPRRWTEFVPRQPSRQPQQEPAPPLPPRGAPRDWINFEEIPERRKPPKRIQTIPSRGALHGPTSSGTEEPNVIYSYVNPEDCKCECHETGARANPVTPTTPAGTTVRREEDELPLLLSADRRSDSSPESQGAVPPPPAKKSAARSVKPTNAFPDVASTSS